MGAAGSIAGEGCARFDAMIAKLGTEALDADDERRVRAHLVTCARCSELAELFADSGADRDTAPASAPRAERAPGATIAGRYRLDRVLGRGGMGVVWAATQSPTGQEVAIKLLDERRGDARARLRFLREARSACAVRHPNVVRVYDVVELDDGAPAIVMERLHGHSLERRFAEGPMPLDALCHVLARVADALSAAHAAGLVHRDLKPENVFLARAAGEVSVKVLDFGVAKRAGPAATSTGALTRTGALVGTPFYMAPEQALGEDDVDARADIWALGIMLYQGLSGVLPTRAKNLGRVIKAVAVTQIEPIDRLVPGLPADVTALLGRMLSKARDERPSRMDEARAVLAKHARASLDPRPDLDPEGAPEDLPSGACDTAIPALDHAPPTAPPRRARLAAIAIATTLFVGAMGLVATMAGRPRARGATASSEIRAHAQADRERAIAPDPPAPRDAESAPPAASAAPLIEPRATARAPVTAERRPPRAAQAKPSASPTATAAPSSIGVERGF